MIIVSMIFSTEGSKLLWKRASLFLIAQSASFNPLPVNTQTIFGYTDAYRAMEKSYASLKQPVMPSKTAMALKIAGGGLDSYGKYNSGYYGQT